MGSESIPEVLLVLDQGTHASRAILLTPDGQIIDRYEAPVRLDDLGQGRFEQNGGEILESVLYVLNRADAACPGYKWCCVTCQRSTLVVWDHETGEALLPAISWMDSRAVVQNKALQGQGHDIHVKTGLPLSPHYLAAKMKWVLDHLDQKCKFRSLSYGPLLSYLLTHLLVDRPFLIEPTVASRTQLYDLHQGYWSTDLVQKFGLKGIMLPHLVSSRHEYGSMINKHLLLKAACGDQSAMPFSNGYPDSRTLHVNLGTGAFVGRVIDHPSAMDTVMPLMLSPLPDTDIPPSRYMIEGSVNGAGSALEWFREIENLSTEDLSKLLGTPMKLDDDNSQFINTVGGLGSPWWMKGQAPCFVNRPETPERRLSMVIASILFLLYRNIELIIEKTSTLAGIERIRVSGGLSRIPEFCQQLANLSRMQVIQNMEPEQTARGAAFLITPIPERWKQAPVSVFEPDPNAHQSIFHAYTIYMKTLEYSLQESCA